LYGDFDYQGRNARAVFESDVGVRTHFAQHDVYFPKEFTKNLIATRKIIRLAAVLASTLMAACGLRSITASTETFTVYEDRPTLKLLDLGPPGNSPGDVYHFFAPLHSSPGGPVTGEVFGSKTLIKMATDTNPNLETRATVLFFTFANRQDQIVAVGATDYPPTAGEFDAGQPVVRAILGGTGKYMGARGQLTSTRNADGSYNQMFTLLK
jgi:hypothetical protein